MAGACLLAGKQGLRGAAEASLWPFVGREAKCVCAGDVVRAAAAQPAVHVASWSPACHHHACMHS
jgi:hypothetical protein